MANTKAIRDQKLAEQEKNNKVSVKTETVPVPVKIEPKKTKLKLDDNVSILVSSNVFGTLTYVNHKTGDKYVWNTMGETQSLYVSDIRAMKSNQIRFLEENWILIEGIADLDDSYEDVIVDEVYEALQIAHYYTNTLCPKNLNEIFNWSVDDIKLKVPKMTQTTKTSLMVRANELIKAGILDSISKLKAFEEVLECELTAPDEE